jgi:hypothetical protein
MPEYEKKPETFEDWDREADARIEGGKMPALLRKLEEGYHPEEIEQRMMGRYIATLNAEYSKNPSDELWQRLHHAVKLSDRIGGSEVARSLVARRGFHLPEDSLAYFMLQEMEKSAVDELTEAQKAQVLKEYKAIKRATEAYEQKMEALREEAARLRAEGRVREVRQRPRKSTGDYKKQREDIRQAIKGKWQKASQADGTLTAVPVPYAKQLAAIAPDVYKLMRSYVEEGVVKLEDIVIKIHFDLQDVIEDITPRDVRDIIAGVYSEPKTKSELLAKLRELRQEAKAINWLQDLNEGKIPVKTEKQKIEQNQKIKELKAQIKEHDITKLQGYKERTEAQIKSVEEQLRTGQFKKTVPAWTVKMDQEAVQLKDKLVKLRKERQLRLYKAELARRSKTKKFTDSLLEILNVPRTIMASADFSAPLRQGIVQTVAHPHIAMKAAYQGFRQGFSEAKFDRWIHDFKESPEYKLMEASGMYISDPHHPMLTMKEEQFMNNIAQKIPVLGEVIKFSERAYIAYLNALRVDRFLRGVSKFKDDGFTLENSPQLYKSWARLINNSTGRGDMGPMETAAPVLNSVFFSPRLIASRFNLLTDWLNPYYYQSTPKQVRVEYAKDMLKFIGVGVAVLGMWASSDDEAEVELDPRSTDFLKLKRGDTRYDIWGGFQPFVRLTAQLFSGETKNTHTGMMQELDGDGFGARGKEDVLGSFLRNKLAPVPQMGWSAFTGQEPMGTKFNWADQPAKMLAPILWQDVYEAWKDQGVRSLFTVGLPSAFGLGVQSYAPPQIAAPESLPHNGDQVAIPETIQKEYSRVANERAKEWRTALWATDAYKSASLELRAKMEKMVNQSAKKYSEQHIKEANPGLFPEASDEQLEQQAMDKEMMEELKELIGISEEE